MLWPKKVPVFPNDGIWRGHGGGEAWVWWGSTGIEWYIICDKSEEMKDKESSYAGWNPVEEGGLLHSLWGRCVRAATASRIAEGSGKDRDSFGFDFRVVAAVIPPPWGPLSGPGPDKLQCSIIQLLPLQSCHRAHRWIIPVFSLQTEGSISGTNHWKGAGDTSDDRRVWQTP